LAGEQKDFSKETDSLEKRTVLNSLHSYFSAGNALFVRLESFVILFFRGFELIQMSLLLLRVTWNELAKAVLRYADGKTEKNV